MLKEILRGNARKFPDKTAIIFGDVRYTFKELNQRVNSLANAFTDMGLKKGDWIAVIADNCNQVVETFWAGLKIGLVTSVISPTLSEKALLHLVGNGGARAMVFDRNCRNTIESLCPLLEGVKDYIIIGESDGGFRDYEELVSSYPPAEPQVETRYEDLLYFPVTSGTTGLPKQIMHTYRSIWTTSLIDLHYLDYDMINGGIGLLDAPLFWGYMTARFSIPFFYMGCPIFIPTDYRPQHLLQDIEKENITVMFTGTQFLRELIDYPDLSKYNHSSLRRVLAWGYLPPEVWYLAIKLFGNIFIPTYGLSEIGAITNLSPRDVTSDSEEEILRKFSSCGKESIGVEARVVDEEGNDVQPDQVGEVIAKGDDIMKGYWNAARATEETIKGGYVHTGDLATVDEEKYIYLKGRKKDAITTQGTVIIPSEIEEIIFRHPGVVDAAVIGLPDKELGEAIKAVVIKKGGKEITKEEIISLCEQNLPAYAIPKSVDFVQSLPKTPSGKVQRHKVRERYIQ